MNVQSLETSKTHLREILDSAYQLISNLFFELDCDRNLLLSFDETITDRNILLYLATIESRVQQLLPNKKLHRKTRGNHKYTDDTTISWRMDHQHLEQSFSSLVKNVTGSHRNLFSNLQRVDSITPYITL